MGSSVPTGGSTSHQHHDSLSRKVSGDCSGLCHDRLENTLCSVGESIKHSSWVQFRSRSISWILLQRCLCCPPVVHPDLGWRGHRSPDGDLVLSVGLLRVSDGRL